jgi:hypothetical protein
MRNLNPTIGLANGTRLVVSKCFPKWLSCIIITGYHYGKKVIIPRINLQAGKNTEIKFMRRQLPVRLAFGMTIHRSQSQTLRKVGLYLPSAIFAHGMLYVACSRIGDPKNMYVYIPSEHTQLVDNIVYNQLFVDDSIASDFSIEYSL